MVALTLLTSALLATAAFAAPSARERFEARVARRSNGYHVSRPNQRVETDAEKDATVSESTNWSGPVYNSAAGTFKSVTGTFTVPTPSEPSGGSSRTEYSASAWVGIDGDSCGSAILQTGVDFNIQNGEVSYDAWYEWLPADAFDFSGISISAGNVIKLTVTAATTTSGTAVVENVTTGVTVTKKLTSSSALCEQDAEWIVEDFTLISSNGQESLAPFADFGTLTWTSAEATTSSGSTEGPSGATVIYDLVTESGKQLTTVSTSSSGATIKYV